jgi:hypothetical protein
MKEAMIAMDLIEEDCCRRDEWRLSMEKRVVTAVK